MFQRNGSISADDDCTDCKLPRPIQQTDTHKRKTRGKPRSLVPSESASLFAQIGGNAIVTSIQRMEDLSVAAHPDRSGVPPEA